MVNIHAARDHVLRESEARHGLLAGCLHRPSMIHHNEIKVMMTAQCKFSHECILHVGVQAAKC